MQTIEEVETLSLEQLTAKKELIVYNDDFNTFDHVIDSLIKICKHEVEQATQCTYIIHFKGKCQVKRGSYEEVVTMCLALIDKGISAKIE